MWFVVFFQKKGKFKKKIYPANASSFGQNILAKGQAFFSIWTLWVSKDTEFYVFLKTINLP
jgi:hypothetical protein